MSKYFRIIIAILVLNSCKTENSKLIEVEYYPDSKVVQSENTFDSAIDKKNGNFTTVEYDSLGLKKSKYSCKNNSLDGRALVFYSNGSIKISSNFKNGKETGVYRFFNEEGFLITEYLFVDGNKILLKSFAEYSKIKSYGYEIFPLRNDTAYNLEGQIIYDTNMKIIDSATFYYNVHKVESTQSDKINLNVTFLGTAYYEYKTNINLFLGELNIEDLSNNMYSLRDTIKIIESEKNELEFSCNQMNIEDDLLTGLLQLELFSLDGSEKIDDIYFTFYYDLSAE